MNDKVKNVLKGILEMFRSGDIPEAVAYASHPIADIPSNRWSFTNRIIMFFSGTRDARGYRQWSEVNRHVKKGSKAFHILVPCFGKEVNERTGEEQQVLKYFKSAPVFRLEDTEGEPLDYQMLEVPDLPLIQRAKEWGINVKSIPGNYFYHGSYSKTQKKINLATDEEGVFFHELGHVAHEKVKGTLEKGQDPFQEIVAELSAQALCRIVGKSGRDTLGNSYRYIESYAKKLDLNPYSACMRVMRDTEKVLKLILQGEPVAE